MLGRGVYLTHFWRACLRYGTMDQKYRPRAEGGAVCRVYVRGAKNSLPVFHVRNGCDFLQPCCCGKCTCDKYRSLDKMRRVSDHQARWRGLAVHGAHVPPCRGDTIDPKTGEVRFLARSDEWCVRAEACYLQQVLRVKSAYKEYDARDRCAEIL